MTARDFLRFTVAFCAVTFGDGFAAGFLGRPASPFISCVAVALAITVLMAVREKRV